MTGEIQKFYTRLYGVNSRIKVNQKLIINSIINYEKL